jgi:N-dimethylarginine dimethylaminohydrolase
MATERPSTLMGEGWRARARTHAEDVRAGAGWAAAGVNSEVAPLRRVLLTRPGPGLAFSGPPSRWLMAERPDLVALATEAEAIAAAYARNGVDVAWIEPGASAPPNLIFVRDLFFMTPEGAVLSRMAAEQRVGEEGFAAVALAQLRVPILATPTGTATLEGADVLWLRPDLVLVGLGNRTNEGGLRVVGRVLADQGVRCVGVPLSGGVQHLLGTLNLVDEGLAVLYDADPALRALLREEGVRTLDFADTGEVTRGRSLNFVTIAPRVVLMPAGCPVTRGRLEAEGVRCEEVAVPNYLRAEGALGCLTGILHRAA